MKKYHAHCEKCDIPIDAEETHCLDCTNTVEINNGLDYETIKYLEKINAINIKHNKN